MSTCSTTTNNTIDANNNSLPTLSIAAVAQLLRSSYNFSSTLASPFTSFWYSDYPYLLSAGSKGYCAFKEMLQNGVPGNTTLIESQDLRDLANDNNNAIGRDIIDGVDNNIDVSEDGCATCVPVYLRILKGFKYDEDAIEDDYDIMDIDDDDEDNIENLAYTDPVCNVALPPGITHITVYTNERNIEGQFIQPCSTLKSIEFSQSGTRLQSLPPFFLADFAGLTTFNMSPFTTHLSTLPWAFLQNCTGLTSLDLSPLLKNQIIQIRAHFLSGCSILKALDVSPLSSITWLPEGFFEGCSGLESLDLAPLVNLTAIHGHFLVNCTGLTTLDLSPLSRLTDVSEASFLRGCMGMKTLTLSTAAHQGAPGMRDAITVAVEAGVEVVYV